MGLVMSPPARCYLDYFDAILSPSPSLCLTLGSSHVSKLKQQSNGRPTHMEGVLPELLYPRQLESSNHTKEPSTRTLQVSLLFDKCSMF
jgi:hypothetical protein